MSFSKAIWDHRTNPVEMSQAGQCELPLVYGSASGSNIGLLIDGYSRFYKKIPCVRRRDRSNDTVKTLRVLALDLFKGTSKNCSELGLTIVRRGEPAVGMPRWHRWLFDLSDRDASLDARNDALVEIDAVVRWEEFRPVLGRVRRRGGCGLHIRRNEDQAA
jgi:hypothetical protein